MGGFIAKAHIFVDFWNFQLSVIERCGDVYRVDWKKFPSWLITQAEILMKARLDFQGTKVYLSYNSRAPADKSLRRWAGTVLARFPGIDVDIRERKPKGPLTCQACHQEILVCPHCSQKLHKTIEKGVDTAIVTDLLSLAWEKAWDIAILVTSDRDYFPAVKMLSTKGYRVINAHFPPSGIDLARTCWASIDISQGLKEFERKEEKSPA